MSQTQIPKTKKLFLHQLKKNHTYFKFSKKNTNKNKEATVIVFLFLLIDQKTRDWLIFLGV